MPDMRPDPREMPIATVEYMTECTLATIETLAMKTRPPKRELERQCSIAQCGMDCLFENGLPLKLRCLTVATDHQGVVKQWADHMVKHWRP